MEKLRISIVSYLNSKPFLFGLQRSDLLPDFELKAEIPSKIAAKLSYNITDLGLIPVAALEDLNKYQIVSNYCIGSVGKVKTVVLASEVPIESIENVLMDYQSRSSVVLAKVLAKFYWKRNFNWENTCNNFQNISIKGTTAGVVIGDRVFDIEKRYKYIYDLSEEWYNFTRLPFVFAVWASTKTISAEYEENLNKAFEFGFEHLDEVISEEQKNYPGVDIKSYLTRSISFNFDEQKKQGMKKFLELARKLEPVEFE